MKQILFAVLFALAITSFAYAQAPTWQITTVDSRSTVTRQPVMVLDKNNKIHIAYYNDTDATIMYATNTTDNWTTTWLSNVQIMIPCIGGCAGAMASIAVDSNGKVHISYITENAGWNGAQESYTKYITNKSEYWSNETVEKVYGYRGVASPVTSIAVGTDDAIHIASAHIASAKYSNCWDYLIYHSNAAGAWDNQQAYTSSEFRSFCSLAFTEPSIAVDSNNKAHVNFMNRISLSTYATNVSGSWVEAYIGKAYGCPSLAIDSDNILHVSYYGRSNGVDGVIYATNATGSWTSSPVAPYADRSCSSLAIDQDNHVHIVNGATYITNTSGEWKTYPVDPAGGIVSSRAIAVDNSRNVHIVYSSGGSLKYAKYSNGVVLPDVTITANDAIATEAGPTTGQFTVTRTGATTEALTVSYAVTGTATPGIDYTSIGTSVVIPAGNASATIMVTPINDTLVESDETVIATLLNVKTRSSATVTIISDDLPAVTITANDATAAEVGEHSTDTGQYTVMRSGEIDTQLAIIFSVSGTAIGGLDYISIGDRVVIPAGASSATITVTAIDDTLVENDETVIVTPSANAAYTISSPSSATVTITSEDVASQTVTITANDATATEAGPTTGQFTVTRTGVITHALTVNYAVTGTAIPGSDYTSIGTSVTIPAGVASGTITVTPVNDNLVEIDETVIVTLSDDASYAVGNPSSATVTIISDDVVLQTVTITANDATATEAGLTTGQFTVARTGLTTAALTVNYAVTGTATSGSDYINISSSVTISAGAASATITVTPINDALDENDETVIVTLSANAAYTVGSPSAATVTISDDDPAPNVQFSLAASSGLESLSPAAIVASLSAASAKTVTVNYATANGTAVAGSDYTAKSGTLTFNPGVTSRTVSIPIANDTIQEPDETYTVTLTNPVNATLGAITTHTRSIYDDGVPGLAGLNTIAEAVDLSVWTFATSAGANWWLQTAITHDGTDAARSGFIGDNQASSFQTTGSFGAGTVSFWWKVSSEPGADLLRFSIDGTVMNTISGEVGWQQKSYFVSSGSHTLKWEYAKNGSGVGGIDAAWVDQIVLPAMMVLWTRGDSGEVRLWTGIANKMPDAAFAVTGQASLAVPSRDGGQWEATSFVHADASTDYVLWSRGDTGQAILAKVKPGASAGGVGDGESGIMDNPSANPFHNGVIPGLTRNPEDRELHWIPDEDLGNDGKERCSDGPEYMGAVPVASTEREGMKPTPTETGSVSFGVASSQTLSVSQSSCKGLTGSEGAYLSIPAGDGGPWQSTSYTHQDASTGFVLWSRSDTGQAILARVAPGDASGTIPITSWAYLNPPTGVGPWLATSYTHLDASTGYVLWSRSDTGQAILWKVVPGDVSGTIPVTSWAYLDPPAGVGAPWQATSYTHVDASEGYVLWSRGDTGQAILWTVVPGNISGTIPVTSWVEVSPSQSAAGPWRATSYVHGATPRSSAPDGGAGGAISVDEIQQADLVHQSGAAGEERQ